MEVSKSHESAEHIALSMQLLSAQATADTRLLPKYQKTSVNHSKLPPRIHGDDRSDILLEDSEKHQELTAIQSTYVA